MSEKAHSLVRLRRTEFLAPRAHEIERDTHQQQVSMADVWQVVARRKLIIIGLTAIIFAMVGIYTFREKPIYEGVARLQIDPARSSGPGFEDGDRSATSTAESRVKTEVAIIQSSVVAMQVINSLKLYANAAFAGNDAIDSTKDFSALQPFQRERLLKQFSGDLKVNVIPDTEVIEIRFRSTDPVIAQNTANSMIDEYMQRNFNARVDGTAQASQWLSKQLDEIRASTTASQERLAEFQKRNNLVGSNESDNIIMDRLKQLNVELTQAEADRIVKEGRYRLAQSGNPELIASITQDTTLQGLRTQEIALEAEYAHLNAKFGSGYPKLQEVQSQLAQLHSAIDAEGGNIKTRLSNEYDAAAKAEAMIRDDFTSQKEAAYKLDENVAQYAILKHDIESGQQLYDTLELKLKEASVTTGLSSSYVSVIDRAQLPDRPVEPRKTVNLAMGLGAGLFFGVVLGFVWESFDDTIQSSERLETITTLPELASIPFHRSLLISDKSREGSANLALLRADSAPVCVREPNSMTAEAYRSLASVVLLTSLKRPLKMIVVTSAMPDEGKSTVSYNLATALAQRGRKVLLVDADMRCSSISKQFGSGVGLSTILAEPREYPVYRPFSQLPSLYVIPTGSQPADPMEVFASPRMKECLTTWRKEYDEIIIDTPPVLPFSDALTLSSDADGVILVTRSGTSRTKAILRATQVLLRSGSNVVGFVLNAVRCPEFYYDYPTKYKQQFKADDGGNAF